MTTIFEKKSVSLQQNSRITARYGQHKQTHSEGLG